VINIQSCNRIIKVKFADYSPSAKIYCLASHKDKWITMWVKTTGMQGQSAGNQICLHDIG